MEMSNRIPVWLCTFATLALAPWIGLRDARAQNTRDESELGSALKVMSFNIRFGTANDGDNHWQHRRNLVAETIQLFSPDLLGVQEALDFQCQFLREQLPNHRFVGRGRESEPESGEFCGVFFRTDRFRLVDSGYFWLSEQPDVPGSKSWDATLPRMVSWVRLQDSDSGDRELVFANTHFDHRGSVARLKAAHLIRQRLVDNTQTPIILVGDFNCGEASEPYQWLVAPEGRRERQFMDSFRETNPSVTQHEGTFSAWKGETAGERIDWILHTPEFAALDADIIRLQQQGRFPSDHYPVQTILKLKLH